MSDFEFHKSIVIEHPIEEVFAFFAEPRNLSAVTPDWLNFRIRTKGLIEMAEGLRLDYTLRLHGFPLRWQSEITHWDPPFRFVDEQRKGPYRYWIHEHLFTVEAGHTRVTDFVRYAVPGGRIFQRLFVARDIERIFAFREKKLREIFPAPGAPRRGDDSTHRSARREILP